MTHPDRPAGPTPQGSVRPSPAQFPPPASPQNAPQPPAPPARGNQGRRRRSVAWVYYSIIAALALIFTISKHQPGGLVITAICAAYATYLFRGGRFVLWIW